MNPNELKKGDIIIYYDSFGIPEHVALYTGHINGKAYVTHQVTDDGPGLKTTILKPICDEDLISGASIGVFRVNNEKLAEKACEIILKWSRYQIPYDFVRSDGMNTICDDVKYDAYKNAKYPKQELLNYLISEGKLDFYQRVKFAARRDCAPVKFIDNVANRGFHCVQIVILVYQVAELEDYVNTLSQIQEIEGADIWISDKHCPQDFAEEYNFPSSYLDYLKRIMPYRTKLNCRPSLIAWKYQKYPDIDKFISEFESSMELPAKICSVEGLELWLNHKNDLWVGLGKLDLNLLPRNFSEQEKSIHRASSLSAIQLATSLQEETSLSPAMLFFKTYSSSSEEEPSGRVSPTLNDWFRKLKT